MNITVSRKDLAHLTSRLAGVADRKSSMPILANALLEANSDTLRGSATDLFIGVTDVATAEGAASGSLAVNAQALNDRVKVLPDGPITLTATERSLTIKSAGSARRFTLPIVSAENFPTLPQPDPDAPTLKVNAATLASLIARTAHAISTDETRPHISSLLVEWDGDTLRTVATDGHRLALAERKVKGAASTSFLLPLKAVTELRRVLDEAKDTDVMIVLKGSQAFVSLATLTLSAKLTDASFPPWRQAVPENHPKSLRVARAPLMDAIKAVSVSAASNTGGVHLSVMPGKVRLTSESADSGDGEDEVPCDYEGEKVVIGVNAKYLLESLAAVQSDEASFELAGELDPIVARPVGEDGFLSVTMPMRV